MSIKTIIATFALLGDTLINLSDEDYYGTAPDMGAYEYSGTVGTDIDYENHKSIYSNKIRKNQNK